MKSGDRVRVTEVYGERFPQAEEYVGREGVVEEKLSLSGGWSFYVEVLLDGDDKSGLFKRDEVETV